MDYKQTCTRNRQHAPVCGVLLQVLHVFTVKKFYLQVLNVEETLKKIIVEFKKMSQKVIKFGSADLEKFIEIYRSHECLWDTDNVNYKNRAERCSALVAFAVEFGVDGYGPKEITNKIKNLRTQYHAERKKIEDSKGTAVVYNTKLSWYNLMDSFLRKTFEHTEATSNMHDTSLASQDIVFRNSEDTKPFEILENSTTPLVDPLSPTLMPKETAKKKICHIQLSSNKHEDEKRERFEKRAKLEKTARLEKRDDDLDNFGKYVTSSLRNLNAESSIYAQDEIQAILSKYKLRDLKEKERRNSTPCPESPYLKQDSED